MSVLHREEVLKTLRHHKAEFTIMYGITSLGIFGSVARGDVEEGSDVDIVFETTTPNLFRTVRMKQQLEKLLSCHVDIVRWRESMNPRLKEHIERDVQYV